MKRVIIAFTSPKKFMPVSWLIKKIEKSEFSHAIVIAPILDEMMVFQATHNNVNIVALDRFLQSNRIVDFVSFDLSDEDYKTLLTIMLAEMGTHYGYLTLLGIAIARLFKVKNPFRDADKSYICSEFVARALAHFFKLNIDFEVDGPKKLLEELRNVSHTK